MEISIVAKIVIFAFSITILSVFTQIKCSRHLKILEFDINKKGKPQVCGLGGISIFVGTSTGLLFGIYLLNHLDDLNQLMRILILFITITILSIIGLYDDIFKLGRKNKIFLPAFASMPLIFFLVNETVMKILFIGDVNFGIIYFLLIIPIGITGASNAVNMSAGYNGLEGGIGALASIFLLIIAMAKNEIGAAIVLASLAGACLGFLLFNWYPARIFPGDVGTYMIGGTIGSAVIIGNMEIFGIICLIPAFYEFFATIYYTARKIERRNACHNPIIEPDGKLRPTKGSEHYTLAFFILSKKNMSEKILVLTMLSLYAMFGFLAFAFYNKSL